MVSLVTEWIEQNGGIEWITTETQKRADRLYAAIDESKLFYCPNATASRSKINVVFRSKSHDDELENRFVKIAESQGLVGLKEHRSEGD